MHTGIGPTQRRLAKYNLLLHSTRMDIAARAMKRSGKAWRPVRAPVMNRFVGVVVRLVAAVPAAADDQAVCFDETSRPEIAVTACSRLMTPARP